MIHAQAEIEREGMENGMRDNIQSPRQAGIVVWLMTLLAATMASAFAPRPVTARAKKSDLPHVTIDHPQFIPASQATYLFPNDMLIGVTDGTTAKAYAAAILAQHGVVQDQMADGPIAVTW